MTRGLVTKILKSRFFWLFLIFAIFILVRIWGSNFPYHQDENTWSGYAGGSLNGLSNVPHPPLSGLLFILDFYLFGISHLRYLPFFFSIINFWLIFLLLKYRSSWNTALWGVLLFSISFYSVLASLMVDTDGQILPFFFLLSAISFYKWWGGDTTRRKIFWGGLLVFSILLGFLTKASFIIAAGAIIIELLYLKYEFMSRQKFIKMVFIVVGALVLFAGFVSGILYFLPIFNITKALTYWRHFIVFSGRNYLQISIQFFKALLYSSPLLLAPLLFLTKDLARKLRLFIIFIILGLTFYLILFDFSSGALDRYFQFMIVPLSIISGVVIGNIFEGKFVYNKQRAVVFGCAMGLALFFVQFLPHFVPALYPKTEWFSRILSLKWNFLFPFIGGSGPMGFYISWLFMATIWLATIILAILAFVKAYWRKPLWIVILLLGFLYNGVFMEEYLFGKINGSPVVLLKNAINFIKNNQDIKKVITYNNIGRRELSEIGKYERRLYVAPKFESSYTDILKNFKGDYLVIEIPKIDSGSIYGKYFEGCKVIYQEFSGKIPARIYDCNNGIN